MAEVGKPDDQNVEEPKAAVTENVSKGVNERKPKTKKPRIGTMGIRQKWTECIGEGDRLVGWFVDLVVGWLTNGLFGLLVGCLVVWFVGRLADWLADWLMQQIILTGLFKLVDWLIYLPIDWSIDRLVGLAD